MRDEYLMADTNHAIRIDLYQAASGSGGTVKPDRRSGSLTRQQGFEDFRIHTCCVILEEGTYMIIKNTKKKSVASSSSSYKLLLIFRNLLSSY